MSRQQNPIQAEVKKNSTVAKTLKAPNPWHEDPNEHQILLNLLNREGFALEDAVYETLSTYRHEFKLHRGDVFEGVPHRDNDRIEIAFSSSKCDKSRLHSALIKDLYGCAKL